MVGQIARSCAVQALGGLRSSKNKTGEGERKHVRGNGEDGFKTDQVIARMMEWDGVDGLSYKYNRQPRMVNFVSSIDEIACIRSKGV
jgi:hypothetical protein